MSVCEALGKGRGCGYNNFKPLFNIQEILDKIFKHAEITKHGDSNENKSYKKDDDSWSKATHAATAEPSYVQINFLV